jgi:hypothetical protein
MKLCFIDAMFTFGEAHECCLMLDSTNIIRKYTAVFGSDEAIYYFKYLEGKRDGCMFCL